MKRSLATLLGLSLLTNAGLVAVMLRRGEGPKAKPAVVSPSSGAAVPHSGAGPTQPVPVPAPKPAEAPVKVWEELRSDDARTFAARLREAGVPDHTARLLVADVLRAQYLARQRTLIGTMEPAEFWKSAAAVADREKQAVLRALSREHQDLLSKLYGPDEESAGAERERLRRLYGPLPDEKLGRVDRIHADYGDIADDVRASAGGVLLASDRETLALLEQERRKDVAAILTPAELEVYDLQTSATARSLRARLAAFAPSEAEFRALFALQRAHEERFGGANGVADEVGLRERATAEAELEARIKTALGEARYADYRRIHDPGFRVTTRIAERFGLPARRATEAYALSLATQSKLQSLRDDSTLESEAKRQALVKVARETGARFGELLGAEGAELYKQTSCGAWLRSLDRVATETAAPNGSFGTAAAASVKPEPVGESDGRKGAPEPVTPGTVASPSAPVAGPKG